MPNINNYWFLGLGILLMVSISAALIHTIKIMLNARDKLLVDKTITVKAIVDEKIRDLDSEDNLYPKMDVMVLVANQFRLSLNIYTIEDYLKYSEGDTVLLKVDKSGSIEPIEILDKE